MRMLSRRPYCSFEFAQKEIVKLVLFYDGDSLHFSNPNAAHKLHKKMRLMKFLGMRFRKHIDVHATQSLPPGPVLVH